MPFTALSAVRPAPVRSHQTPTSPPSTAPSWELWSDRCFEIALPKCSSGLRQIIVAAPFLLWRTIHFTGNLLVDQMPFINDSEYQRGFLRRPLFRRARKRGKRHEIAQASAEACLPAAAGFVKVPSLAWLSLQLSLGRCERKLIVPKSVKQPRHRFDAPYEHEKARRKPGFSSSLSEFT
jgi:hypothetical protein